MAANKYPGRCKCGAYVPAQAGTVAKSGRAWIVSCDDCGGGPAPSVAPVEHRLMVGTIYWPNGLGERECSAEYEDAHAEMGDARDALDDLGGFGISNDPHARLPEGYSAAYERYCRAQAVCDNLQAEGGHLGEVTRYDTPDVMGALMGGGRVNIAPGGGFSIAKT